MAFNLYLMRHGIAEDFDPSRMKSDADRHLTDEGRDKLKQQAKGIAKLDLELGALMTSPFVRARETAELIMPGLKKMPLETMDELVPNAEVDALLEALRARQQAKPVLCFSHEPLLSSIVGLVLGGGAMVEVKKGTLIGLELSRLAPPWRGQLLFLLHPKAQRAMA